MRKGIVGGYTIPSFRFLLNELQNHLLEDRSKRDHYIIKYYFIKLNQNGPEWGISTVLLIDSMSDNVLICGESPPIHILITVIILYTP